MNYYEILEVSVNASKEVIKNAYRALSKKYHPDTYKGDKSYAEEKLKEINSAYETLIDEEKRLLYDYDNGFKIDPNAPIEVEENIVKNQDSKEEVKQDEDKFLKKKKAIVILAIIIAFIFAFVIGLFIATNDSSTIEEEEDKKEQITDIKKDTTNNKNNSNYSNRHNNISNNFTDNSEVEYNPPKEEKEDLNVNNDNIDNSENIGDYGIS